MNLKGLFIFNTIFFILEFIFKTSNVGFLLGINLLQLLFLSLAIQKYNVNSIIIFSISSVILELCVGYPIGIGLVSISASIMFSKVISSLLNIIKENSIAFGFIVIPINYIIESFIFNLFNVVHTFSMRNLLISMLTFVIMFLLVKKFIKLNVFTKP